MFYFCYIRLGFWWKQGEGNYFVFKVEYHKEGQLLGPRSHGKTLIVFMLCPWSDCESGEEESRIPAYVLRRKPNYIAAAAAA